jgi:hypothetical protein
MLIQMLLIMVPVHALSTSEVNAFMFFKSFVCGI